MNERDLKFLEIEKNINARGGDGEAVAEAYRKYYAFHEVRMLEWVAKLFDPDIGGFYYSNSGRDNDEIEWDGKKFKTGPDVESTIDAIGILTNTGVIKSAKELPDWMKEKMIKFVSSLQSPEDGYIYHPQWGDKVAFARRGRDLNWAISLQNHLDFKLPYKNALDRMRESVGDAEKRKEVEKTMPEHLRSSEAFKEYLEGLDWFGEKGLAAYGAGNALAAQAAMIHAAGLYDQACEFLDSIQNKETGIWGVQGGYAGVNAILKVANVYAWAKRPIPNPEIVARTSMEAITTPEDNRTVCYQFNAWWSVDIVRRNTLKLLGADGEAVVRRIDAEMLPRAVDGIRATIEKITPFKCDDGSYSYFKHCTCPTSQSALVAMEVKEGDINATTINCQGVLLRSVDALGLTGLAPDIFGPKGYEVFLSALKKPNA
jgi:soluble cytochrome b562